MHILKCKLARTQNGQSLNSIDTLLGYKINKNRPEVFVLRI